MSNRQRYDEPATYQIRLQGKLDARWLNWFNCDDLIHLPSNQTLLKGVFEDQAALHGLLARIRDLGIPILLIERVTDTDIPCVTREDDNRD